MIMIVRTLLPSILASRHHRQPLRASLLFFLAIAFGTAMFTAGTAFDVLQNGSPNTQGGSQ
jgi:hypothetical protein